jgi:hypothetical protein
MIDSRESNHENKRIILKVFNILFRPAMLLVIGCNIHTWTPSIVFTLILF